MKSVIKNERGVTLISLAVAIIILGIITSMLIYNVKDTKDIERVSNMYIDIEGISDRVSNYYSRYGALPVRRDIDLSTDSTISEWVSELNSANNEGPLGANDTGNFYVIDMNALENLSLNYGVGYEKLSEDPENKDLYVINENSHNIFYLHGIKVNNNGNIKMYYTNQDKDTEVVDIRYKDGIRIPDGFNLISGNTKNDLVIKNGSDDEYKWANTVDNQYIMTTDNTNYYLASATAPETKKQIVLGTGQTVEDLILSAKEFGGFYFTPTDLSTNLTVNYFSVAEDDNWGVAYDVTAPYTDRNGDKAYIPKDFKISKLSSLNTINKGLVIKNETTGDEYVWIDVPDNVLANARTLEEIENALKEYTKDYREEGYEDTYEGDFINLTNGVETANSKVIYNNLKNKMLQSIKENGGFYIGRYEASKSSDNKPQSQKDKMPRNTITVANAQSAANALTTDNYTTSLMFGIQWDLVCKFLEETGTKTYDEIAKNSKDWGNYRNSEFVITSDNAQYFSSSWADIAKGTTHISGNNYVLSTAASNQNKALNLYDFSGNVWEWTLEKSLNENEKKCVARGGNYYRLSGTDDIDTRGTASCRYVNTASFDNGGVGFRVTLFQTPTETPAQP